MRVVDHHDDLGELFITRGDPELAQGLLKSASWRESSELMDRDFALILVDDLGREHRKFACFDAGNTALSEFYLLNGEHSMSRGAIKLAATNILAAAENHGLQPSTALSFLADMDVERDTSMDERRAFASEGKEANALMGYSQGSSPSPMPKMGSYGLLESAKEQWADLDPYDRHETAVHLCKLGSADGVRIPNAIFQYGGESLNPRFEALMHDRQSWSADEAIQGDYDRLGKMASVLGTDDVVEALYLLDEKAGLLLKYGSRLPDPLLCVFGQDKEASWSWMDGGDYLSQNQLESFVSSEKYIPAMEDIFKDSVVSGLRNSPVSTFKGLPHEQKLIVARLASQSHASNSGGR